MIVEYEINNLDERNARQHLMLTEGEMLQLHICTRSSQVKITLRDNTLKRLLKCRTGGVRYYISKLSGKKTGDSGAAYFSRPVLFISKNMFRGY